MLVAIQDPDSGERCTEPVRAGNDELSRRLSRIPIRFVCNTWISWYDWGDIGRAVSMNEHSRDVSLLNYDFFNNTYHFMRWWIFLLTGLAMNRSICKLKIAGWDLYQLSCEKSTSLSNALTQFFTNNQSFKCLVVDTNYIYGPKENGIEMCAFVVTHFYKMLLVFKKIELID